MIAAALLACAQNVRCGQFLAYCITNRINGKKYIGVSKDLPQRLKQHYAAVADESKAYAVHRAIKKHGIANFNFEVLACAKSWNDILWLERTLIVQHNTFARAGGNGYNLTSGGRGAPGSRLGLKSSPEHVAKIRAALRGRIPSDKTIQASVAARKGKPLSPEHIEKSRASHLGGRRSPETRRKMSAALKGRKPSEKTIQASIKANTGKRLSQEQKDRLRLAWVGKSHTPEAKAAIGAKNRGRSVPEALRERIRQSLLGRRSTPETLEKLKLRRHSETTRAKMSASRRGKPHSPEHRANLAAANRRRALERKMMAPV